MKKILSLLLCMVLLCSAAMAEVELDGGEKRNIRINKAGLNFMEDGISPTTGLDLAEVREEAGDQFVGLAVTGRYMPMLVQISNPEGGVGYDSKNKPTGYRAPWGAQYTDVIYETALQKEGETRLSFLFSDLIPPEAGPVRSARLFHAYLREEWDCGFCFYGQQEYTATNVPAVFKQTGADRKAQGRLLFSGTVGEGDSHPWKAYYTVFSKMQLKDPNDISANVAAMNTMIPANFEPANHTWLFTDDEPDGGDEAEYIYVNWGVKSNKVYNSILEWDEDEEHYVRKMVGKKDGTETIYSTLEIKKYNIEAVPIYFNNVIVQFIEMEWLYKDAPMPTVLGTGNADYYMGGQHFSGVWNRDSLPERTVFYDENGDEIELQRGRTLIIVMDYQTENRSVSYE